MTSKKDLEKKPAQELTNDEVMERIFNKNVVEELKKTAEKANKKGKSTKQE